MALCACFMINCFCSLSMYLTQNIVFLNLHHKHGNRGLTQLLSHTYKSIIYSTYTARNEPLPHTFKQSLICKLSDQKGQIIRTPSGTQMKTVICVWSGKNSYEGHCLNTKEGSDRNIKTGKCWSEIFIAQGSLQNVLDPVCTDPI
jgi:hypothetical protein